MNCREFENLVNDLARVKALNAEARKSGLAHADICERCASRLMDERALSVGLKSLAASDDRKIAPDNVEAALLAAFRAQSPQLVANHSVIRSGSWSLWAWPRLTWSRWALAAAALLIAFGFVVYRAVQNEPQKEVVARTEKTPTPQPSVEREDQPRKVVEEIVRPEPRAARPRRGKQPQPDRIFIRDSITAYADDTEYMTDFFPLSYGADQKPMDKGEVIRVQMPRSALARFGLPVNVERADVTIKADLLVGEDGLAHAIRFVR
jgi:hypothetical protein